MNHGMVDLETFGLRPGCVLRSIGLVMFDPENNRIGDEYYANISEECQLEKGCHKDDGTVAWWNRQSSDAQQALLKDQKPFAQVADELYLIFRRNKGKYIWGQGANFDVVLLAHHFHLYGLQSPWLYYNARDTRTAYEMGEFNSNTIIRQGTYHNALDDAKHQVRCVQAAYKNIRG